MNFKPAPKDTHAGMCGALLSENGLYKVVKYGKSWGAYTRHSIKVSFGDSCFRGERTKSKEYKTYSEAISDCIKHNSSRKD